MNSKHTNRFLALGIFLVALNIFAFYILQKGIGIAKAINNTENKEAFKIIRAKANFNRCRAFLNFHN